MSDEVKNDEAAQDEELKEAVNELAEGLLALAGAETCDHSEAEWCPNSPAQLRPFAFSDLPKDEWWIARSARNLANQMVVDCGGILANMDKAGDWVFEPELTINLNALLAFRDTSIAAARRIDAIHAERETKN